MTDIPFSLSLLPLVFSSKWPLFYVKIVYASGRAITPATLLIVDLGEYTSVKFNSCTKHAMSVTSNGFSWYCFALTSMIFPSVLMLVIVVTIGVLHVCTIQVVNLSQ
jgi:hypothetical protein